MSHLLWHLKNEGLLKFTGIIFRKVGSIFDVRASRSEAGRPKPEASCIDEVFNLKPGEWVQVKSEDEILATLDDKNTYKGLRWMCNMRNFCGKRYRVFKRLETMLLESSGKYRQVKNTVLLEGVICDGQEWFGCDRSCYHFWREVWLRRVELPDLQANRQTGHTTDGKSCAK